MHEDEPYIDGEEREKIIARCEEMLSNKRIVYFDVVEFEALIDHYFEDNKLAKAMYVIDIALKQHPGCSELEMKKAKLLIERNRSHEALEMINRLLAIDSINPDLHIMRGTCLADMGKIRDADLSFGAAVENSASGEVEETYYACALAYIDNNLYTEALPYLEKAHAAKPSNTLILYDLAYAFDRTSQYEKSIEQYKKYLDIDPYSDNAWYNMGIVYSKMNEYSDAINAFEYALAVNENYASAYFNKANTLANWEKYEQAISVYQEYLDLDQNNVLALYYIGECYEKLGDYGMALDYYGQVLKIDRKYSDAWFGIGIVKYYEDKYEEAKGYMEKAIELDAQNSEYWLSYGNVLRALEYMPKETLNAYKKATQISQYDAECWLYYADALKQYAGLDMAIDVLKKAQTYIDNDAEILFTLAAYYYDKSMLDVALKLYLQAVDLDIERAEAFYANCQLTADDRRMFIDMTKNAGDIPGLGEESI
jgi:tetratricopeptide (TPR) repeat protein